MGGYRIGAIVVQSTSNKPRSLATTDGFAGTAHRACSVLEISITSRCQITIGAGQGITGQFRDFIIGDERIKRFTLQTPTTTGMTGTSRKIAAICRGPDGGTRNTKYFRDRCAGNRAAPDATQSIDQIVIPKGTTGAVARNDGFPL